MRLVRTVENELIRLKGAILDLRRERDNHKRRADKLQTRLDQLKTIVPNAAAQENEFNQLRERYKGHTFTKAGKVKLRETA